jgi:hypothetical protein
MFTARYALSPYIKQISFVFKGLSYRMFSDDLVKLKKRREKESDRSQIYATPLLSRALTYSCNVHKISFQFNLHWYQLKRLELNQICR